MNEKPVHGGEPHRSQLPSYAYLSPEIYRREQERLFRSLWIFVGPKQLLRGENAFLTRTIGGLSVVVQNVDGRLRAFENRCLHRQMVLQTEAVGRRPMICKYHGWSYDANGCVKGIPNVQMYEFTAAQRAKFCLREFALKEIGNLLFVCVDPEPRPFGSQFTPDLVQTLESSSMEFDWEVAHAVFDVRYNWKLNFENVLDWNHVQFIHSKTFYPLLNGAADQSDRAVISPHIRKVQEQLDGGKTIPLHVLSYSSHCPLSLSRTPWASEVGRYGVLDDYYNWFLYPNVNYCSVHGKMFLIQQYVPKAPKITEYHLWVMTARRINEEAEFAGLLWSMLQAEKRVIDEDAVVLEALQDRLPDDARTCINGAYEAHIVRMHRWYAKRMDLEGLQEDIAAHTAARRQAPISHLD